MTPVHMAGWKTQSPGFWTILTNTLVELLDSISVFYG